MGVSEATAVSATDAPMAAWKTHIRSPRLLARRYIPIIVGVVALIGVLMLTLSVRQQFDAQRAERFGVIAERLESRVQGNIAALRAIRGLILAENGPITRRQLQVFLSSFPLETDLKGAKVYGLVQATPTEDMQSAIPTIRRDYGIDRAPWPKTYGTQRFPIVMVEPATAANEAALGFDMYVDPVRRAAMQKAAASHDVAVTPPIRLLRQADDGAHLGFIAYVPIFLPRAGAAEPGAPTELFGFVYAAFRIDALLGAVLPPARDDLVVKIYHETVETDKILFGHTEAIESPVRSRAWIGDMRWIIEVGEAAAAPRWRSPALLVLALGVAFAVALTVASYVQLRQIETTERLAEEVARSAEQKEILLQEMRHRIKNAIARTLALFRLSAREGADKDTFARDFERRLEAMANAQSLLTIQGAGGMSLHGLLNQATPDLSVDGRSITATGPHLELD